jgi:hypothetical protein
MHHLLHDYKLDAGIMPFLVMAWLISSRYKLFQPVTTWPGRGTTTKKDRLNCRAAGNALLAHSGFADTQCGFRECRDRSVVYFHTRFVPNSGRLPVP